ncbi:MAG TPA: MaoC family dehydratase N-terminal domain-containing protein [Burkholderiales bacterium]|nr:MaoC family dehydratase N-terminal domain-containing protein [Burkholderiales bacterium]
MSLNIDHLREWIGRTESRQDQITLTPIAALSATLDRDDPLPQAGDPLPPLWHWLYFLPIHRQSEIGPDGHPKRGGFLPPVPLPRRMWAGSRLEFPRPLRVGDAISRNSRIVDVSLKEGRAGPLVFVLVRHEISDPQGSAWTEEHDIVYRDNPNPGEPAPKPKAAPAEHAWERTIHPDDVFLFRYSALTFNGHRIHYDRRYVTEIEGYPGLVVHGPLIATLLLDLLRRKLPDATVARFAFRAVSPLFDIAPFSVCGKPEGDGKTVKLWAKNAEGALAMEATATLT